MSLGGCVGRVLQRKINQTVQLLPADFLLLCFSYAFFNFITNHSNNEISIIFTLRNDILFVFIRNSLDFMKLSHNQVFDIHAIRVNKIHQLMVYDAVIFRITRHGKKNECGIPSDIYIFRMEPL